MLRTKVVKGVLGLSAVAASLLAAIAVHAQAGGGAGSTGTTTPTGAQTTTGQSGMQSATQGGSQPAAQSGQSAAQAGATGSGTGASGMAKLSSGDRKMVMSMAQDNLAEIEMGRLAQNKSQNEQVKNFAQQMIDDHTKALAEVQQLAQARGIALSKDLDRKNRARADKLAALSGDEFDRAYMAQAGVSDHKKNHSLLRSAQSRARDPELKALAARTLPVVDQHLNSAQQLHKNTARGRSGTQGTSGSSGDRTQQNQQNQQNQPQQQPQPQQQQQQPQPQQEQQQ